MNRKLEDIQADPNIHGYWRGRGSAKQPKAPFDPDVQPDDDDQVNNAGEDDDDGGDDGGDNGDGGGDGGAPGDGGNAAADGGNAPNDGGIASSVDANRNNSNLTNGNAQNNNLTLAPINPNYRLDRRQYDEPFDLDLTKVPTNDTTQNKEIDYSNLTFDPALNNYLEYHVNDILDGIFQTIAEDAKSDADWDQTIRENNAFMNATISVGDKKLQKMKATDKMDKIATMIQMRKAWKKLKQLKKQRNPFLNGPNTEENKQLRINRGRDIIAIITR